MDSFHPGSTPRDPTASAEEESLYSSFPQTHVLTSAVGPEHHMWPISFGGFKFINLICKQWKCNKNSLRTWIFEKTD